MEYLKKSFTVQMSKGDYEPECLMCGVPIKTGVRTVEGYYCPECYKAQKEKRKENRKNKTGRKE
jgi:predicted RNA-binding Zn-ribbon protein involved in translation (DUF1610 family)